VFRYVREGVDVLAAVAPTRGQALDLARRKAFVILDGTPATKPRSSPERAGPG
jgi:hypothetical protein